MTTAGGCTALILCSVIQLYSETISKNLRGLPLADCGFSCQGGPQPPWRKGATTISIIVVDVTRSPAHRSGATPGTPGAPRGHLVERFLLRFCPHTSARLLFTLKSCFYLRGRGTENSDPPIHFPNARGSQDWTRPQLANSAPVSHGVAGNQLSGPPFAVSKGGRWEEAGGRMGARV